VQFFDLTRPIAAGMPVYPGDPAVIAAEVGEIAGAGYRTTQLSLGSHTGTHIDAPRHCLEDGADVMALSPDVLIGPGRVADVRHRRAGEVVLPADLAPALPCRRLLICTGWDREYETPHYFTAHPGLAPETAEMLLVAGVRLLGLDTPGLHRELNHRLHCRLLGAGTAIVEGLVGLERLAGRDVQLIVAPLALAGGDGAPARVFASLA
jgi:arylformamidase